MEIWNPYDGTIQLVLDVHPQETVINGIKYGLFRSNLVPIKGKKRGI